ncbi:MULTISPECIES: non-homologous end joining protein Ku [Streptomyces]|uniref:Non-homologous end joining protein Ku n=1 Tax=Streptomyces amritsarensis TaxID=681158 RepID=A0ABX3G8E1_9ACTN|nr:MULTISPECIES: Ku protein [Streptomyces]MDX6760084.1 Ku protein [Streptomyces sp. F8]OLZ69614.1 Ku protein [Streptomyces amritsarensis]
MARPVWAGNLSFGLVSLPVGLYTATDSHTIRFHQLQRGTSDRIRNRRVNERTGEEVGLSDIVKGYDAGGEYVLVEPKELDEIAPGRSQTLEMAGFVDLDEVEPIFFDKTYYLGPRGKEYEKVYSLLEQALSRTGKAGIATFVMRQHEYLVAVKAEDGLLTLHTLHWADEIRNPEDQIDGLPGKARGTAKEVRMAEQLIEALAMKWDPEQFHDTFQEKVAALIEAKKAGETVEKAEPAAEPTGAVDLMEALRASVERARSPKGDGGKATASGKAAAKKAPAKKRVRAKPKEDLGSLSKADLYKKAAAANVSGRSHMTRDDLVEALSSA